jgi:hypothetical protein
MADEVVVPVCPDCKGEKKRNVRNSGTGEFHTVRCHCQYELPIRMILQKESKGCGIAAVAMAVGKTYEEVRQYMNLDRDFTREGMFDSEMEDLLEIFGFSWQSRGRYRPRLGGTREVWPSLPFAPLHIVQVKNLPDKAYHFVILLPDGQVMDPWWGVIQGLHRYPQIVQMHGVWKIPTETPKEIKNEN